MTDASVTPLLLIDDELIALAIYENKATPPSGLPTVDVQSADEILTAAQRGIRSLKVRGFVNGGEIDPEIRRRAEPILSGRPLLETMVLGEKDDLALFGTVSRYYSSAGGILGEAILSDGIHSIWQTNDLQCSALLQEAVIAVFKDGVTENGNEPEVVGYRLVMSIAAEDKETARRYAIAQNSVSRLLFENSTWTSIDVTTQLDDVLGDIVARLGERTADVERR